MKHPAHPEPTMNRTSTITRTAGAFYYGELTATERATLPAGTLARLDSTSALSWTLLPSGRWERVQVNPCPMYGGEATNRSTVECIPPHAFVVLAAA
jgi:hypothetical protein